MSNFNATTARINDKIQRDVPSAEQVRSMQAQRKQRLQQREALPTTHDLTFEAKLTRDVPSAEQVRSMQAQRIERSAQAAVAAWGEARFNDQVFRQVFCGARGKIAVDAPSDYVGRIVGRDA